MSTKGLTLLGVWEDIQLTRYTQLASSSIIIYDHLVTLDSEINLIWKSSWSMGKVLFIINRYYSLFSVIFNNYGFFTSTLTPSFDLTIVTSCNTFFHWQGWTGLIASMVAEAILTMRLYALYSLNKKVLALMLTCYITCSAAAASIMGFVLQRVTAVVLPIPGGVFCAPQGVWSKFYTFWIPMLAFETLLCTLALIRGFQTFKAKGPLFSSGRMLVGILIRDSVFYFLVICVTYLSCLLVWISAPVSLLEVPIGFSVAMSCVLGNRIVLNVREVNNGIEKTRTHASKPSAGQSRIVHIGSRRDIFVDVGMEDEEQGHSVGTLSEIEMHTLRGMRVDPDLGRRRS